jgi:hypothetical protein
MSEPKYQRVCIEGEARVFPGDLDKVLRLSQYFDLEVSFPDAPTVALVKVLGRKT